MRINDIYSNSGIQFNSQYGTGAADILQIAGETDNASGRLSGVRSGDIIEGIVSDISRDTTRISFLNNSFQNGEKEISFSKNSIDKAFVGQKRAFEVVENTPDKLVLRDLGGIAGEIDARSIQRTNVDSSLVTMTNDFARTNGGIEEEDDGPIERLTDEDYSELRKEGFSIEDFKAERLTKAIERIKTGRASKQEHIEEQSEELKRQSEETKKRAAAAVSAKYSSYQAVIDRLYEADMPITDANIAAVVSAMDMGDAAAHMSDNSFAYLIKNELKPSIKNIYTSVYSGVVRRSPVDDASWKQLEEQAQVIVDEANASLGEEELTAVLSDGGNAELNPATLSDARWMLEYEIPLNSGNLVYKKELEELKDRPVDKNTTAKLASVALANGEKAEDALMIPAGRSESTGASRSITEMTAVLKLQEIRLSMTTDLTAVNALEREIAGLKNSIKEFYGALADEIGATDTDAELAAGTASVIESIANAPLDIYRTTFSIRATVTLAELGDMGSGLIASSVHETHVITVRALAGYEASETEIRKDLGDSIQKAFRNAGALVEQAGLEVNEANLKAVRILGYNSMEITADSIREMKYYDAKLTGMIDGMKPSVVLSMIRDGFNPLEHDIDSINTEIERIMEREGYSPEEKFSRFLVELENSNAISESEREAYIGIYRLLYQIGREDGAAIGSALASGRELTLENLLTEARTRRTGVDVRVDDNEAGSRSDYVNSITGQILSGFAGTRQEAGGNGSGGENNRENAEAQQTLPGTEFELSGAQQEELDYNTGLAREAADVTNAQAWADALAEDYEDFTLEQVTLRLKNADKQYDGLTGTAEEVRSVMMASAGSRSFLRSLGIKDSKNNLEVFDEDLALEIGSKDDLIGSLDSFEDMRDMFAERAADAQRDAELELLGSIAILSRGREIEEQLHSYNLLSEMAEHEHYRMNVETGDGAPARINLTVIHGTGAAGTVSIAVSASSYSLRADLSMTVYASDMSGQDSAEGVINGRITASGNDMTVIAERLRLFIGQMSEMGYDADGLKLEEEAAPADRYMDGLAQLAASSQKERDNVRDRRVSTNRLYGMAKIFLANFI